MACNNIRLCLFRFPSFFLNIFSFFFKKKKKLFACFNHKKTILAN